jgi:hypothetical protein
MQTFLDNKLLGPQHDTFAAALKAAADEAARTGRVIVEAMLDGAAVADDILERPPEQPIGRELRLTSVQPRALVRVTLMDAADALEAARQEQHRSADLIQTGKVDEALPPLSAAIQTWQAVRDAVEKSAALLRIPLDEISLPGGASGTDTLIELIGALAGRLEEVKRSLAAEDWSALADVLAYDLGEQVDRWKLVLVSLSDSLRTEP